MSLQNKVAIITGSSGGIGQAITRQLYSEGALLTITGRSNKRLEDVSSLDQTKTKIITIPADLKNEKDIEQLFKKSFNHWGRLDILINNAASGIDAPLIEGSSSAWREMLDVNVLAVAITMSKAIQYFHSVTGGYIVNVTSTSAHRVPEDGKFYTATKFAVKALSEVMRQELRAKNNRTKVINVSPGRVATNMFNSADLPLPNNDDLKVLNPEDVAQAIIYQLKCPSHVLIQDLILSSINRK